MIHGRLRVLPATALLLLSACGGDGAPAASPDAGSLPPPEVIVGGADGDPAHVFDRVFAALNDGDRGLIVANSGTGEIRYFSRDGKHRFSTGSSGSGPGEFRGINWMARLPGDSILVWDMRNARFTVLEPRGTYARDFRPLIRDGRIRPVGVLPDGSIVVVAERGYDPRAGAGVVRDRVGIFTMSATGAPIDSLAEFPGTEWLLYEHPASYRAMRLPFGEQAHVAVAGRHIAYASSGTASVTIVNSEGERTTLALPLGSQTLSRSERDALLREEVEDPAERSIVMRHFGAAPVPAPMVVDLRGDAEGNLWVQTFRAPASDTDEWLIVPAGGGPTRRVELPAGAVPLEVRRDAVVLRLSDADGVQRVSLHRIAG